MTPHGDRHAYAIMVMTVLAQLSYTLWEGRVGDLPRKVQTTRRLGNQLMSGLHSSQHDVLTQAASVSHSARLAAANNSNCAA